MDEAAVHGFALAEKLAATRRAYRSDFGIFTAWRDRRGFQPLPAAPAVVAAFPADQAQAGVRPSTLSRRVAAIAYAHDLAGLPSPANAKAVRVVLGGIRRTKGAKPAQKAPATAERITAMLEAIPDTLRGKRDRALLTLGFAGAFRRSELVALGIADLTRGSRRPRIRMARCSARSKATVMVEESTAATHSVANETESLATLTGEFRLRESVSATPVAAPPAHCAKPNNRAFLRAATDSRALAATQDDWEEF